MRRILSFAKRNFKEILRDPLSIVFCFIFPTLLLVIMEVIMQEVGGDMTYTPQFRIENLTPSIIVFSFAFLTLFASMLISKDRNSSFLTRLFSSPIKPIEYILGYSLPLFPIAIMQSAVTYAVALLFGFKLSWTLLLSFAILLFVSLLFIALGLLIGSIASEKASGGLSSLIINLAVFLGGFFFPLETMSGALVVITKILPFAPAVDLVKYVIAGNYSNFLIPFLTVLAYIVALFGFAIWCFYKKMKSDKR